MRKKVKKLEKKMVLEKPKRVAAYARVSSGKDAMLHSLSAQVSHYSELIQVHEGWQYAGVYADEALTGTNEDRADFQRLLSDCRAGLIDMSKCFQSVLSALKCLAKIACYLFSRMAEPKIAYGRINRGETVGLRK